MNMIEMDTAVYDTNVLVLNDVSSVSFSLYEPYSEQSQTFGSIALEIENNLREQGYIVYYDASRRGIWYFHIVGKDGNDGATGQDSEPSFTLRGQSLSLREKGSFEPNSLQKFRPHSSQPGHTLSSSTPGAPAFDQAQGQGLTSTPYPGRTVSQEYDSRGHASSAGDAKAGPSGLLTPKAAYENFILATLMTMSSAFCNRSGALPLNYRTVLLPHNMLENEVASHSVCERAPTVGTFRAYLTTTGALVVSMGFSICPGLSSLNDVLSPISSASRQQILAAPFGLIANHQAAITFDGGTASMAQTPNTQVVSLRGATDTHDSLWKQACLRLLQLRGVTRSTLVDCCWINLLISKPKFQGTKADVTKSQASNSTITIPWPGPLCFRQKLVKISSTSRVGDTILSGHDESHDPLGTAQAWYSSSTEREEKLAKRKAERTVASNDNGKDNRQSRPIGQSPLNLRRPSTVAVGSMYPTPPDALQNVNGVTPSMDGNLSSPGNPLSAVTAHEADNNGTSSTITAEPFETGQDFNDSKRQTSDSNLLGESENIFGGMSGDEFGDNDITEADFNFFDEQASDIDIDAEMAEMSESGEEAAEINAPKPSQPSEGKAQVAKKTSEQEPNAEKDEAVFAKPELRHAISVQNDGPASTQRGRDSLPGSSKRESSPFNPHTVFKRVRASLIATEDPNPIVQDAGRMTKIFEKMEFDPTLPMINKKYEQGGQFDYSRITSPNKPKFDSGVLSEINYLRRQATHKRGPKDHSLNTASLMGSLPGLRTSTPGPHRTKADTHMSDGESSSTESDQEDLRFKFDEPTSPLKPTIKHPPVDEDNMSPVTSLKEAEAMDEPDHQLAAELPRLSIPDGPDTPLSVLFSDPEPLSLELSLNDEDFIQVAQILTEQAATGTLNLCNKVADANTSSAMDYNRQSLLLDARAALGLLGEIAPSILRGLHPTSMKGFLDVQDVPFHSQLPRLQPRPIPGRDPNAEQTRPSNLYQIPGPHLEVRRSDNKLSVLPSAVEFWESLGLGPSSGSKDVTAVCVFPGWKGMVENAKTFLGRMKSVYEVLRLGSLDNMVLSADMDDGILPYEVDLISTSPDATLTGHGSALVGSMEGLRGALSNLNISNTNVVVYFVYSPNNPGTIVEACTAFQRFFELYQRELAAKKETAANELVLQLVSVDVLSSPTSIVVTPSPELVKLCLETYDRCTLFGGPMPAPAIRLEQPLPRIIDFKLTTTPSASLIRENSCIHVAYAQTVDERWVTAAWTDDRGNQQATASYCLGRKGRPQSRPIHEIATEIWESTLDLISTWKVHWRIIITKCGPMAQQEIDSWVELARTEIKASVTMILMTVDTKPSLQLMPPMVKLPQASAPFYTTPVSTPQASIVSPEQSAATPATPAANTTAATPGGDTVAVDPETDAVLADITDQTWGAIVGHRLNCSPGALDWHPALVSGYLIKRTGARMEDAPVVMELNLVHTDANPRAYEPFLREMLSYFRGLATLARARGIVPRDTDVRPWHIAAAEKAARALYLLM